jgi:predicted O-methyltransferase YrrM
VHFSRELQIGRAITVALGLVAAVTAALGWWQVAVPVLALLLSGGLILGLTTWRHRGSYGQDEFPVTNRRHTVELAPQKHANDVPVTSAQIMVAIDAMRAELTAINDQMLSVHDRLTRLEANMPAQRTLTTVIKDQTREVEALLQLYAKVDPRQPMPPSGRWALNPQSLLNLFTLVRRQRPRVVVELGSGTSTVWIGYALAAAAESTRPAQLISLDHDESFAEQSQASARLHAEAIAPTEVRFAPLKTVHLGDEDYRWYDPAALADVRDIDLLIVDGPPGGTGPLARYPALPLLADRLTDGAVIVLDDATRDDEKKIIDRWLELPEISREWSAVNRQAVFRHTKRADA